MTQAREEVKTMFAHVGEARITRAIITEFSKWLEDCIVSDAIVVGGGPSGLMAAGDVALRNYKTLLIESNNYLGGGFWMGGYLMKALTFRYPAREILDELQIPNKEFDKR